MEDAEGDPHPSRPPGYRRQAVPGQAEARSGVAGHRGDPPGRQDRLGEAAPHGQADFERPRDKYGYTGCSSQVRAAVARGARLHRKEVYVPLSHPPGHAQFDFGEATVIVAGIEQKVALAVMTLPYSDAYFLAAYPRECTETFHAEHQAAFSFYRAVPLRTSYDITSIAVK